MLIPDCKGDAEALATIFDARPDVLNHNLETVARLQRAARPSAGYARSLALLARAKDAGLVTKSGIILGMGETDDEVRGAIADLRNVGVDILTLGQYLRPRPAPAGRALVDARRVRRAPRLRAEALGFGHVEAGPLVRSSYHARARSRRRPTERPPPQLGMAATRFHRETSWPRGSSAAGVLRSIDRPTDGHVNVSPKGYDTFRVLDERPVAYLDLTGSGVETIAHQSEERAGHDHVLRGSTASEIVRLYGQARGRIGARRSRRWGDRAPLRPSCGCAAVRETVTRPARVGGRRAYGTRRTPRASTAA